jgi:hypothetical protein
MDKFQENIKKWVQLDSQLTLLNEKMKEIRTEKTELSSNILNFVEHNNLNSSIVKISDGRLKFTQNKHTMPLTLGFLESCLLELLGDPDQVQHAMNYIKAKRETKVINEIKRYYNN